MDVIKYRENIYRFLTHGQGFDLEEINRSGISIWIAIKRFEEGNFVLFFTSKEEASDDGKMVLEYINEKGEPYQINRVVLSKNSEYQDNYNRSINDIVIDNETNKVIVRGNNHAIVELILNVNANYYSKGSKVNQVMYTNNMPVTMIIIAINIVMFLISAILSKSIIDIDSRVLLVLGAKYVPIMTGEGQYYRLITEMFLHGGIIHLAFNMFTLYSIGGQIEYIYGKVKYLMIYFLSGIGAGILSCFLDPKSLSVGASGAIFGLFGTFAVYAIKNRDKISKGIVTNILFVIGMNLYIGLTSKGIDNAAHIGGLIMGALIGLVINKKALYN